MRSKENEKKIWWQCFKEDEVRERERERKKECDWVLYEYANRKWNCAHQKSTHCEKRVVLAGRRVVKQTLWKIHLFLLLIKCAQRERKREKC